MNPDLYALVLRLRPVPDQSPPNPQGHGAQALFLDLVRQVDPELAAQLHADAPSKPYSVAILPRDGQMGADRAIELRVAFTRADLFPPVTRALLQQSGANPLRLGSVALELADVCGTPGSHLWAGYAAFAELAERARPAALATLAFVTPTAFGQGTRGDGRARVGLLPLPETVFKSLAQRWNELAPPALALDLDLVAAAARDTLLSRYQLQSCQISLGKGPQKGFTGVCAYELPPDPQQARCLALLADAAFYLGVGMKTARGMGLCTRQKAEG